MMKKKQVKEEEIEKAEAVDKSDNEITDTQEKPDLNMENPENTAEFRDEKSTDGSQVEEAPGTGSDKEAAEEVRLEEKLAEMQDRYLRLSAEFDNYRKRTLREKIELTKHAGENVLMSIIPVMDDFERAIRSMDSSTDCTGMKDGIDLIYNKFRDFLKQHGIREIEALHTGFNVDLHEAVSKTAVEDESLKGKVVEVVQKGYYLHDKVMRFARVVVGE